MGLKFSALDTLLSLMKTADYYLDNKINKETSDRVNSAQEISENLSNEMSRIDDEMKDLYNDLYLGLYLDEDGDVCQR